MLATSAYGNSCQPAAIVPAFVLRNRKSIEAEIERLIAVLDACDGDCDLEDDDPAGDALDHGERGGDIGDAGGAREFLFMAPIYGIDQTLGPINEREALLADRLAPRKAA